MYLSAFKRTQRSHARSGVHTMKTIILLVAITYTAMLVSEAVPAAVNTVAQVTAYAGGAK